MNDTTSLLPLAATPSERPCQVPRKSSAIHVDLHERLDALERALGRLPQGVVEGRLAPTRTKRSSVVGRPRRLRLAAWQILGNGFGPMETGGTDEPGRRIASHSRFRIWLDRSDELWVLLEFGGLTDPARISGFDVMLDGVAKPCRLEDHRWVAGPFPATQSQGATGVALYCARAAWGETGMATLLTAIGFETR